MAQLKQQLSGVTKHGFWILSTITILGSVGISFWSASQLASERDKNLAQIEADNASMKTISSAVSKHPNDKTSEEMDILLKKLEEDVKESWTKQYERQTNILVWPVDELGTEFVDAFKDFSPIELTTTFPVEKEVEIGLRTRYRDYIGGVLPDIAKIAGAEWTADFTATATGAGGMGGYGGMGMGGMGGMGGSGSGGSDSMGGYGGMGMGGMGMGGMGMGGGGLGGAGINGEIKDPPLVQWSTASQTALMSNLFPWRPATPDTLDVLYSQENLWILRQLMELIATVNGDAKQPFQAAVREINEIAIGKAASSLGGTMGGGGGGYMGMGGGSGGYMGMGGGSGDSGGMGGMGMGEGDSGGSGAGRGMGMMGSGMGADGEASDPADSRYVDVNYEPIDAETLRSEMASRTPETAFAKVAKRVPIKLNLKIDQRKIPLLVAECGNAPLSIEVRQVRINPGAQATGGMGGMGGMGMGMGGGMGGSGGDMGMGGGMGMGGPGGGMGRGGGMGGGLAGGGGEGGGEGYGGMGGMGMGGSTSNQSEFPNEATVELYGVIYIYNPPAMEELGQEQVDENTLIEGDTETVSGIAVESEKPIETLDPNAEPGSIAGENGSVVGGAGAGETAAGTGAGTSGGNGQTTDEAGSGGANPSDPGSGQPGAGQPGAGQPGEDETPTGGADGSTAGGGQSDPGNGG